MNGLNFMLDAIARQSKVFDAINSPEVTEQLDRMRRDDEAEQAAKLQAPGRKS